MGETQKSLATTRKICHKKVTKPSPQCDCDGSFEQCATWTIVYWSGEEHQPGWGLQILPGIAPPTQPDQLCSGDGQSPSTLESPGTGFVCWASVSTTVPTTCILSIKSNWISLVVDETTMEKNIVDCSAKIGESDLDGAGTAGNLPGLWPGYPGVAG